MRSRKFEFYFFQLKLKIRLQSDAFVLNDTTRSHRISFYYERCRKVENTFLNLKRNEKKVNENLKNKLSDNFFKIN